MFRAFFAHVFVPRFSFPPSVRVQFVCPCYLVLVSCVCVLWGDSSFVVLVVFALLVVTRCLLFVQHLDVLPTISGVYLVLR